jgi:hypothetical protein
MKLYGHRPKYEFCGAEWLVAFHAVMAATVAASATERPDLTFSMSEISLDPPPDIGGARAKVGWSCFVEAGRVVRFAAGEVDGVDFSVVAPYGVMLELCRFEVGPSPERASEYAALTRSLAEAGEIRTYGKRPRLPRPFALMHDIVAGLTA